MFIEKKWVQLLALAFCCFTIISTINAQTFQANYTYDANGNRISATVIYLTSGANGQLECSKQNINLDNGEQLLITIYPNPTKGNLRVDIAGIDTDLLANPSNHITVWDLQGKLLLTINPTATSNIVDLTEYNNGLYIMQLTLNGKTKDYKIVKN